MRRRSCIVRCAHLQTTAMLGDDDRERSGQPWLRCCWCGRCRWTAFLTALALMLLLRRPLRCDVNVERATGARGGAPACTMKLGGDEDQDATDTCDRGATTPIPATTPAMRSISY